jgi:receptor-type tyrosine-protein phosphatase gamma
MNVYEVVVRGATKSTIDNRPILGESSIPMTVMVTRDCDKIAFSPQYISKELSAGVIAGMVCACFAVMLAIMSFVLWK